MVQLYVVYLRQGRYLLSQSLISRASMDNWFLERNPNSRPGTSWYVYLPQR
jgi:hypothetical protein